jgi:uncharacterized membrane protein YuzA (DUF378 family)
MAAPYKTLLMGYTIFMMPRKEVLQMWDKLALALLIIGGLNWGLVGIFEFDLVAWLFGGSTSILSRVVYILVAISAIWCSSLLFRLGERAEETSTIG